MVDVEEYEVGSIRVRLPGYLRPKKTLGYFEAYGRGKRERAIFCVSVERLAAVEAASVLRGVLEAAKFVDWMGVRQRAVRRGAADYVDDGYELLSTSENTINGEKFHKYDIVFSCGGRTVSVAIFGPGDLGSFDRLTREIVSSIRVAIPGGAAAGDGGAPSTGAEPRP